MKIMYVGKEPFVDVPVMPGEKGGRIGRLQGADVHDALAHALIRTKEWEIANESYTPAPPDTKDEAALTAAGYDPATLAAAQEVARQYQTQGSVKAAEADPAVEQIPPGNPTIDPASVPQG